MAHPVTSNSLLRSIWGGRHILKIWRIGREERVEYKRLLGQLLRVRDSFIQIARENPQATSYRFPFRPYDAEPQYLPVLNSLYDHLSDTEAVLKTFGWQEEEIARFALVRVNRLRLSLPGADCVDRLYDHEALLRGLGAKSLLFDIERKLKVATERATGISPRML